jgi:hypothetical protein
MDPITIALGLAQLAPSLMRFFGAGEKNTAMAEKVIDMAVGVTGAPTSEAALETLRNNQAKAYEFQTLVLQSNASLEALYLADVTDARKRDVAIAVAGNHNYRADTMYVLAVLIIGILVWQVLKSELDEYAKGIITLVLGRFLGYLDNIYNFEFGTTRASKNKDETIKTLSNKQGE